MNETQSPTWNGTIGGQHTRHTMSAIDAASGNQRESGIYEIRLKGHLDQRWADRFDGLTITLDDNGETRLTGPVVDQAALHGLLRKIRDLGLPLVAVSQVEPKPAQDPHAQA
jgi:hypothetical protein